MAVAAGALRAAAKEEMMDVLGITLVAAAVLCWIGLVAVWLRGRRGCMWMDARCRWCGLEIDWEHDEIEPYGAGIAHKHCVPAYIRRRRAA